MGVARQRLSQCSPKYIISIICLSQVIDTQTITLYLCDMHHNMHITQRLSLQMHKKHCKQFVELSRCERVMTTRAEFHFSWVYTFAATARSLRIWATHPPRETGCDPAPPAQLCWSSSSSFPRICTTTSWNWTVTKLIQLLRGIDSTNFRFLQCPGVLALIWVFSSWILIIAK